MKPIHDYFYRFPQDQMRAAGRCRVRIYKSKNGIHTVLLTELRNNRGESIAAASDRVATDLVMRWGLNPKTTRWLEHIPPDGDHPQEFDELKFTWDDGKIAHTPEWRSIKSEEAEALTGESLDALNRAMGDFEPRIEEASSEHAGTQTQRTA
jgi:hypothetical protein